MQENISLLIVEDDEDDFFIFDNLLKKSEGLNVSMEWKKSVDEGIKFLSENEVDIIFTDYYLGAGTAIEFIDRAKQFSNSPIIVLTGVGSREKDIEVMKLGASDYLSKDKISTGLIDRTIRYNIERKKHLDEISNSAKMFKQLYDISLDSLFVLDENFEIIRSNNTFDNLFGKKSTCLSDIFQDDLIYKSILNLLKREGQVLNKQFKINTDDGVRYFIFSISGFINIANNKNKYQGKIREITKLRRIQEKSKRQEKINATGKMARTIAHEIRNPLSNISLSLGEINAIGHDQELETYFNIIKNSCTKINDIVTEFINSTKPEKLELKKQNINQILQISIEKCKDKMDLKGVQLDLKLEATNFIELDENKLPIVFTNLLVNAVEACEETENPVITVATQNLSETGGVQVCVEDNGKGMDAETQKNLFNDFYTKKSYGLGVGMSAIYNLLNAHDAHIDVVSEIGDGTRFSIYFD